MHNDNFLLLSRYHNISFKTKFKRPKHKNKILFFKFYKVKINIKSYYNKFYTAIVLKENLYIF